MDFVIVGNVKFLGFLDLHDLFFLGEGFEVELFSEVYVMAVSGGSEWSVFQIILELGVFISKEFFLFLFGHEESGW
jgi:hypothetical protein